jgi:hypothetical protein
MLAKFPAHLILKPHRYHPVVAVTRFYYSLMDVFGGKVHIIHGHKLVFTLTTNLFLFCRVVFLLLKEMSPHPLPIETTKALDGRSQKPPPVILGNLQFTNSKCRKLKRGESPPIHSLSPPQVLETLLCFKQRLHCWFKIVLNFKRLIIN